jgi:hypothetical protein
MATPELALIPTGYKAGKVYSVLPETGVGDFDFTRASAATRINSNGLLEVPQYSIGSDVVTNGSFATDSDWNLLAGWTISGGKANALSLSGVSMNQDVGITVGKTYKITYTISEYVSGSYKSIVGGASQGSARSSNGTFTDYINAATGSNGRLYLQGNGGFTGSIDNVSVIEWAINDVPRLEYPLIDGVVNGCPSLLLEPQATNLITYPISFGNPYWTKSGATIEGDPSTAGVEEVVNGDMEAALATINGISFTGYHSTSSQSTDQANSGTKSLKVTGTANIFTSYIIPNDAATAGKTYLITYAIYVPSTLTGSVDIQKKEGGVQRTIETITNLDQWVNVSYYFNATSYTTDRPILSQALSGLSTEFYYIDNVSVKEVQGYSSPSVDFPTSGFKLVEDTSTALHYCIKTISVTSGTSYTYSFIAKYSGRHLQLSSSTAFPSAHINYDLQNGTLAIGSGGTVSGTIEALPDGYYRCTYTDTANATSPVGLIIPLLSNSTTAPKNPSYTGDGTSGIYIFMAQLETGSVATSPTLTSLSAEGTTTTRLAEACNGAGDASTFNGSEGVLMAEISALSDDGTYRMISLSNGTVSNVINLQYSGVSNTIRTRIENGGSAQADITYIISSQTVLNKIAVSYKSNQFELWSNGIKVGEDTSGTPPSGINKLSFDSGAATFPFYGKTKQIQYFNTVLTSAELETLTSWTSFISMANAQQYNII